MFICWILNCDLQLPRSKKGLGNKNRPPKTWERTFQRKNSLNRWEERKIERNTFQFILSIFFRGLSLSLSLSQVGLQFASLFQRHDHYFPRKFSAHFPGYWVKDRCFCVFSWALTPSQVCLFLFCLLISVKTLLTISPTLLASTSCLMGSFWISFLASNYWRTLKIEPLLNWD